MEISGQCIMVFCLFLRCSDWIVLNLVWFERSLHSAKVSGQSCTWTLKLMTSQAVEGTWIRTGGYGRLRGEWVKCLSYLCCKFTWLFFISSIQACSLLIFVIGSTILLLTDLTVTCRTVPSHQLSSTLMNTIIYYQWLLGKLKQYILL